MKIKESEEYCPPRLRLIESDYGGVICQSDPARWATDTDPFEDRF